MLSRRRTQTQITLFYRLQSIMLTTRQMYSNLINIILICRRDSISTMTMSLTSLSSCDAFSLFYRPCRAFSSLQNTQVRLLTWKTHRRLTKDWLSNNVRSHCNPGTWSLRPNVRWTRNPKENISF